MASRQAARSNTDPGSSDSVFFHTFVTGGLAALGILVAFALIWYQVIIQSNHGHDALKRQDVLNHYTQLFNGRISELQSQVGTMAEARVTLDALSDPDPGAKVRLGTSLAGQHPYILRVDLIERGSAKVNLNADVPVSFAALDLIRRAETSGFVGPEVSLNQPNLIYAAQSVEADAPLRGGILLVVFDKQFFSNLLSHLDASQGTFKVIQKLKDSPSTTVMQWGNPVSESLVIEAQLSAPHWSMSFESHEDLSANNLGLYSLLIPLLVALVTVGLAIHFGFIRYRGRVRHDANLLTAFAIHMARGHTMQIADFKITELEDVAIELENHAQTISKRDSVKSIATGQQIKASTQASKQEAQQIGIRDDEFLDVTNPDSKDNFGIEVSEEIEPTAMDQDLDPDIFRAYDIRGITSTNLTEEVVYSIGRAFAAEAIALGQKRTAVGWDGRNSSEPLQESLTRGLADEGMDVITIGQVPTPLLYYATHALETGTGIMITGSHNPPEYNGLKMMIGGVTLAEELIQNLYKRLLNNELNDASAKGQIETANLDDNYVDQVIDDITIAQPLKIVVDCGNGVAGKIAPRLFEELGCEVIPLYCEVDGDFPNHHPDPADPENLQDLITVVQAESADLGLAFDGDGDRVGVVTGSGEIIWPDKLIMLFAQDIVRRNPGADIIYDVKCSRHLSHLISELGGRPIMWKTGHSHIKAKIKETGALLGGEFSGHICFGERWYGFDDALYSAARLLEILSSEGDTVDNLFAQFPLTFTTPELKIVSTESKKFEIMDKLEAQADWDGGALTTIDGIRVDFDDGWGLIRSSNTSPVLTLRFEADDPAALERIQDLFTKQLAAIDSDLSFR